MVKSWEIGDLYDRLKRLGEQMDLHEQVVLHEYKEKIFQLETEIDILKAQKNELSETRTISFLLLGGSLIVNVFLFFCSMSTVEHVRVTYT